MKTNETMTPATAAAVLELRETAPGIGFNLWNKDASAKFAELRPSDAGMFTMKFLPTKTNKLSATHYLSADRALSVVRECSQTGNTVIFWACYACENRDKGLEATLKVSHGLCPRHQAELLAEASK